MHTRTILATIFLLFASAQLRAEFAIRDGDTIVFLGDSITAARTYGKIVENYTLLRFPELKVHFINAGWGGDTAAGGLKRLQRDVFDKGATLVTVAYGINDIGWGGKADEEHRKLYLDSIAGIVDQCKAHNVRVFICSAGATASDPEKSADDFLQKMCDAGMEIST
jgi:lysophospholipase L1-like esterase